jgi:hypothetical protein
MSVASAAHSGSIHFASPGGEVNPMRREGVEESLGHMAANGWTFLPSSGVHATQVTRTTAAVSAPRRSPSPAVSAASARKPAPHGPYIISVPVVQNPAFSPFGFGGTQDFFFNGFTGGWGSDCFFFGGSGFHRFRHRFWGWGGYGGWGLPSYGYYQDQNNYQLDYGSRMDIPGEFIGELGQVDGAAPARGDQDSEAGVSGGAASEPAQLVFKDGSAYAVKSYWVRDGQVYYHPVYGGTGHMPLDQLDLSATVEANARAGVSFTLSTIPPHE